MRTYFLLIILLLVGLTGSAFAQTAESPGRRRLPIDQNRINKGPKYETTTPASDEIRCRGYRGVGGGAFVYKIINTRVIVTGETIVTIEMAFNPALAAAGADGRGLYHPGECAWADRPITDKEPYRVASRRLPTGKSGNASMEAL